MRGVRKREGECNMNKKEWGKKGRESGRRRRVSIIKREGRGRAGGGEGKGVRRCHVGTVLGRFRTL